MRRAGALETLRTTSLPIDEMLLCAAAHEGVFASNVLGTRTIALFPCLDVEDAWKIEVRLGVATDIAPFDVASERKEGRVLFAKGGEAIDDCRSWLVDTSVACEVAARFARGALGIEPRPRYTWSVAYVSGPDSSRTGAAELRGLFRTDGMFVALLSLSPGIPLAEWILRAARSPDLLAPAPRLYLESSDGTTVSRAAGLGSFDLSLRGGTLKIDPAEDFGLTGVLEVTGPGILSTELIGGLERVAAAVGATIDWRRGALAAAAAMRRLAARQSGPGAA